MLAAALILDALLGEPRWLWSRVPHPVVWFGRLIQWMDTAWNRGHRRQMRGVLSVLVLLAVVLPVPLMITLWPAGWPLEILGAAILLSHKSLLQHVAAVATGLRQSLAKGRQAVSMIVGRDPEQLQDADVARAAIESAAENFSDGVVAPAFWFAIAGLPGIVAYKAVNTADSMIGHRTERHQDFGWAAARLDDVMNWIPARLTGALFLIAGLRVEGWDRMRQDAPLHRSVNAGWPEAAMAVNLDLALAGPRVYAGTGVVDDPYMNASGRRTATVRDIDAALALLWRAWALTLGLAVGLLAV